MKNIQELKTDERALNRFISAQQKRIGCLASQFVGQGLSLEQLKQEGSLGLWRAVNSYDKTKGASFDAYTYGFITGYMRNAIEEMAVKTHKNSMELDTMTEREKERVPELQDWNSANYTTKHRTATDIVEEMLGLLKERDAWVIRWQFGIGDVDGKPVPVAEIARRLNLTPQAVNKIKNNALDIFRNSELSRELWFAINKK